MGFLRPDNAPISSVVIGRSTILRTQLVDNLRVKHDAEKLGADEGSRTPTPKNWVLKPACIPIPPHRQIWCGWREFNSHARRRGFLRPVCIAFHHNRMVPRTGVEPVRYLIFASVSQTDMASIFIIGAKLWRPRGESNAPTLVLQTSPLPIRFLALVRANGVEPIHKRILRPPPLPSWAILAKLNGCRRSQPPNSPARAVVLCPAGLPSRTFCQPL